MTGYSTDRAVTPSDPLAAFLQALFPGEIGLVEVRALPSRAQVFSSARDEAAIARALTVHPAQNLYIGVATRRDASNGTLTNCCELWTAFVDVDFKTTTESEARTRLGTFPIPPHVIVHSGGGLHAYWRLREPFQLPDEADASRSLLRRLAVQFGGDLASAEPARVLRLPTSTNYKYDPPVAVALEHVEDGAVNVSELLEWLPPEPVRPNGAHGGEGPFAAPDRIAEGARNQTLYRLARSLHAKHLSPGAMHAALHAENLAKCDPPLSAADVDQIAAHAAEQPDRPDFVGADVDVIVDGSPSTDKTPGLDVAALEDVTVVAAEGLRIAETGVPYVVERIIPAYGGLGFVVAFAKVGKTTFGQALAAAVATGQTFLGYATRPVRVLILAAEDPPEYTAYLARHLSSVPRGALTFYRQSIRLTTGGLTDIAATVRANGYGLVLIASWQAVVRGLIRDENDNARAVSIVEEVKAVTRQLGVPWLIDAHSGKGEDQTDDADPSQALRGASGAAAAADYTLSLRYANGAFGSHRRLSGKGRFVTFAPLVIDHDLATGTYHLIGNTKDTARETTWRLIRESGAICAVPQTADAIAKAAGLVGPKGQVSGGTRRKVRDALYQRDGVRTTTETHRGQSTTLYLVQSEATS